MNYEPFEDGRRMGRVYRCQPVLRCHTISLSFLMSFIMSVIKETSGWLCFCCFSNSCEAPLRVLGSLVMVQEELPGSPDESASLSAPFMA